MPEDILISNLHPLEIKILLHFDRSNRIDSKQLIQELQYNLGQCNQAFSWLLTKNLIREVERKKIIQYEITSLGKEYKDKGLPEERILKLIKKQGPQSLPQLAAGAAIEKKDAGSAFGSLRQEGVLTMDENKAVYIIDENNAQRLKKLKNLLMLYEKTDAIEQNNLNKADIELINTVSKKRGIGRSMFKIMEKEDISYQLTSTGIKIKQDLQKSGITGQEIGVITPEILKNEEWHNKNFRSYNLNTPPVRVLLGRRNPYAEFLEKLKDKLVSLGFEEYDGPLVETEFWNSDALYMPQFHSARDIHDVYHIKEPQYAKKIDDPYLSQVAATHENGWQTGSRGWGYNFDKNFTKRLILRSQGTVLSAKAMTYAKVPGKYFGVVRCFRYDKVDATHLPDFYQTEGIVLGEDVNLKTLLGLLKMFAEEVAGAKEVKYVPGYFPFTEPSVEVHIKHPVLGWFELGGSGIFRPEMVKPLGVDVPVLAWGLGIDRMALMSLGLKDIRHLFSFDIEQVRLERRS